MQRNTLKEKIEEAVRTHSIHSVLGQDKKVMICPLPQHIHSAHTPSFSIFSREGKEYWKCHGSCHLEGDVIDLVGYLRIPDYRRDNPVMVEKALNLLDEHYPLSVVMLPKETTLDGSEWLDFLPPQKAAIEYAAKRGLTRDTMDKFRVGQKDHWMTIPAFQHRRLKGIKMRNMEEGEEPRFIQLKGSRQALFNLDAIELTTQHVFMAKAEIPCMLLDQLGFLACAPTGGEGGWDQEWRTALALSKLTIIGDNDLPGHKLGQRRADLLNAKLVFPPDPFKDIDEYYLAEPEKALAQLKEWSC
jgi:hypothetical protein